MDLFRYSSNAWGQTTLEGASWEWLPVFFGIGLVVIVGHAVYMAITKRKSD